MAPPSRRGGSVTDSSPGSRFSILNLYSDSEFPTATRPKNKRASDSYQSNSFFSKNSRLEDLKSGPKFMILQRNETDEKKTMNFVSPFTIQKSIELHSGQPKNVKRLRNGTLLIETVNKTQADKLCKLKLLGADIQVKVFEHPTLNQTKGTIYCPDLIYESDETILEELKNQYVTGIVRIKKKKDDAMIDTGVFIMTFNLPALPEKLFVGFISCNVQLYVPNPRRCFRCQAFGHGAKFCEKTPICGNCAEQNPDPNIEVCSKPKRCKNCDGNHAAWDRKCLTFIKEREIQQIQTTNKITYYQARQRYAANNQTTPPPQTSSYTDALNQTTIKHPTAEITHAQDHAQRTPKVYQFNATPKKQQQTNTSKSTSAHVHEQIVPKTTTNEPTKHDLNRASTSRQTNTPNESTSTTNKPGSTIYDEYTNTDTDTNPTQSIQQEPIIIDSQNDNPNIESTHTINISTNNTLRDNLLPSNTSIDNH